MTDQSAAESVVISVLKKDLGMSCLNPLSGILPDPPAKRFASLSESQLDELTCEKHSEKTKDVTRCFGYLYNK